MKLGLARLSIGARLFLLLLMFGALPLGTAIAAGYFVALRTGAGLVALQDLFYHAYPFYHL